MLKQIARLEAVVGTRVGHFLVDNDAPIAVVKAMCDQFLAYLQSLEDKAKADAQAQPVQESAMAVQQESKPAE